MPESFNLDFIFLSLIRISAQASRFAFSKSCLDEFANLPIFALTLFKSLVNIAWIFTSLKIDQYTDWSWIVALWPIWIMLILIICTFFGVLMFSLSKLIFAFKNKIWNRLYCIVLIFNIIFVISNISIIIALISGIFAIEFKNYQMYNYVCFLICEASLLICFTAVYLYRNVEKLIRVILGEMTETTHEIPSETNLSQIVNEPNERLEQRLEKPSSYKRKPIPKYLISLSNAYFRIPDKSIIDAYPVLKENLIIKCLTTQDSGDCWNGKDPTERASNILIKPICKIEYDSHLCSICLDNPSNCVAMPCGHSLLCFCCALVIVREKICHICRKNISIVLKVKLLESNLYYVIDYLEAI